MATIDLVVSIKAPEAFDTEGSQLDLVHFGYTRVLQDLLPPGRAFTRRPGSVLQRLLAGIGMELSRVQRGLRRMLAEAQPATSITALSLWETLLGLPECDEPTTLAERQEVAAAKLAAAAGHAQDEAWWEGLFAKYGYTLDEWKDFEQFFADCEGDCDLGVFGEYWLFYLWMVTTSGDKDAVLECHVAKEQLLGYLLEVHYHWMQVPSLAGSADLRGVATSQDGWTVVVGLAGKILRSKDMLTSWATIMPPVDLDLQAACSAGKSLLVAVGNSAGGNGALYSDDAGVTWSDNLFSADELYGVTRVQTDSDDVIAVGEAGKAWLSANGGASWTQKTTPTATDLFAACCCTGAVVAVGASGKIIRTPDSGANWTEPTSGTAATLRGVAGLASVVVAVGAGGVVIRSSNAGANWSAVTSGTEADLYAVTVAPLTGRWTACGASGTILQSDDGGVTWTATTIASSTLKGAGCSALINQAVVVGSGDPKQIFVE